MYFYKKQSNVCVCVCFFLQLKLVTPFLFRICIYFLLSLVSTSATIFVEADEVCIGAF